MAKALSNRFTTQIAAADYVAAKAHDEAHRIAYDTAMATFGDDAIYAAYVAAYVAARAAAQAVPLTTAKTKELAFGAYGTYISDLADPYPTLGRRK